MSDLDATSNLWDEIIQVLNDHHKDWNDIIFVTGDDFNVPKNLFKKLAKKTNYDFSYGRQEIANDLKVVGLDFWLERAEYDGSEWWVFKQLPKTKLSRCSVTSLVSKFGWESLIDIFENG